LSGAVKKVTDQHVGTNFTTSFDNAGRVSGVNTVGYGGGITQYASNLQYRASGAAKAVSFGNNTSASFGYDARMQLESYSLMGANFSGSIPLPVNNAYQYYNDSKIKFAQDQGTSNSAKDRAYQYDHAERLQEAFSGSEARDFVNNTNSGTPTGPYRQSFTYDQWDNELTSGGRFWSRTEVVTATYNQSNRNPAWSYDAEGNVTSRNETYTGGTSPGYNYDAAGRKINLTQTRGCWLEPQHLYQLHAYTNSEAYDGDGQVTQYQQQHRIGTNQVPGWPANTYYLRSTVLGGRVISQYDQEDWNGTYVYAGEQRIGVLSKEGGGAARKFWRTADPVTGDEVTTTDNGVVSTQAAFDPQGVLMGWVSLSPAQLRREGLAGLETILIQRTRKVAG
jgi:YD repeat-containing protein